MTCGNLPIIRCFWFKRRSTLLTSMPKIQLPWWLSGEESPRQCRRPRFDPWVRKIPWRRKWQPTPLFLSVESDGWRSLVGYIQSTGLQRVRHDWATSLSFFLSYSSVTTMLLRSKSTEKEKATKREVYKLMADLFVNVMTIRNKFFFLLFCDLISLQDSLVLLPKGLQIFSM